MSASTQAVQSQGTDAQIVAPVSLSAPWQTVIAAGANGPQATAPSGSNPEAIKDAEDGYTVLDREGFKGTLIQARFAYDAAITVLGTPLAGVLYGRCAVGASDPAAASQWSPLKNKNGDKIVTFTPDLTGDATLADELKRTTPDPDNHTWDTQGNDEFMFVPTTAVAGNTGGALTSSKLEMKVY